MAESTSQWTACETNTHQDHVVAHVLDTSVLGYFLAGEAAHMALDIGFIWTIYLDAEMSLLPESLAVAELDLGDEEKRLLAGELSALHAGTGDEEDLRLITRAPEGCRIVEVEVYARREERRLVVHGEEASLSIETSPSERELRVSVGEAEV